MTSSLLPFLFSSLLPTDEEFSISFSSLILHMSQWLCLVVLLPLKSLSLPCCFSSPIAACLLFLYLWPHLSLFFCHIPLWPFTSKILKYTAATGYQESLFYSSASTPSYLASAFLAHMLCRASPKWLLHNIHFQARTPFSCGLIYALPGTKFSGFCYFILSFSLLSYYHQVHLSNSI